MENRGVITAVKDPAAGGDGHGKISGVSPSLLRGLGSEALDETRRAHKLSTATLSAWGCGNDRRVV